MQCLLCNRHFNKRLTIKELLWPQPIEWPLICEHCRSGFTAIQGSTCPICCAPQATTMVCRECRYWQKRYPWKIRHTALYRYNEAMKDYMHRYKFNGDYRLRMIFTAAMTAAVATQSADVVVPIPVTEETMQKRGFNQVVGLLTGIDLCHCLGTRGQHKPAQSSKNRHERLQTPQPFKLVEPTHLGGQRVLLVDDVYTTGRTIYHAAQLAYNADAVSVTSLSLAR